MENEVPLLKKKIKQLQAELCQRTRNYLYHFKKSPSKLKHTTTKQQEVQTQQTYSTQKPYQYKQMDSNDLSDFQHVELSQLLQNNNEDKRFKKNQISNLQVQVNLCSFNLQTPLDFDFKQQNQKHHQEIQSLSAQIRMMKQQLQKSKSPMNKFNSQFSSFSPSNFMTPSQTDSVMQKSYTSRFQVVNQQSSIKLQSQNQQTLIQEQHLKKQLKILKKQVRKLRQHLQYEIKACNQTKQALLISEQQNYKFRLKIQQLNKQIKLLNGTSSEYSMEKIQISSINNNQKDSNQLFFKQNDSEQSCSTKQELQRFKNQNQKYQEHISILEGVKKDYLNKCIQAKEEIYRLKIDNQKLRVEVASLKRLLSVQAMSIQNPNKKQTSTSSSIQQKNKQNLPNNHSQQKPVHIQQRWSQIFKSKVHQISNCLPLKNDEQIFIFRPQTVQDLISMLQRILTFCQSIQQWQRQKIQAIQRQRSNLLKIISSILVKHPNTKHTIAEQISQIPQMCYLVNFLNRQNIRNNIYEMNNQDSSIIGSDLKIDAEEIVETR